MSWFENLFISETNKRKIEEIKVYLQEENYDKALFEVELLIGDRTVFVELYSIQALCYIKKERPQEALRVLDKIFSIDKNHKDGIYYMGLIHKGLNNTEKALENFRKAINLGYNNADIYNDLALIYLEQNETEKAITQLKIALSKTYNYLPTYRNLVTILVKQNDFLKAIELCQEALKIKPDLEIIQNLAKCYIKTNEKEKAILLLDNLIKTGKKELENYLDLIKLHLETENYSLALEKIEQALQLYPNNMNLKIKKLEIFYYQQNYSLIRAFYESMLIKNIENSDFLCLVGIGYLYCEQLNEAELHLKNSIKMEQDFRNTYYLACCMLEKKEFEQALKLFLEALTYNTTKEYKFKNHQKLYQLYLELKNFEKALGFSKKALELADNKQKLEVQEFIKIVNANKLELDTEIPKQHLKNTYEVYNWLKKIRYYLKKEVKFQLLENQVEELIYDLNQPINIAVMGEFKAGKSTFINALLGKELAPMGVTPTTATLNFFKYNNENKIRLIKKDSSIEELALTELAKYVDERVLDKNKIEELDYIEILFDWEKLKEINVIDTPGLNAGITRHEELTQDFIKKADIVLWVFDVEQAVKHSEKKVFDKIKELSKNLISVVNGIDKVDSEEEVTEVLEYIENSIGTYFDKIIPISAKKALYSKLNNNIVEYEKSGFKNLEEYLEQHIYSKVAEIKIQSTINNIANIFASIETVIVSIKEEYHNFFKLLEELKTAIITFEKETISKELTLRHELQKELDKTVQKMAKEIKEFIKPTQGLIESVFGKNKFETQDKNFVTELLKTSIKTNFELYAENFKIAIKEILKNNLELDKYQAIFNNKEYNLGFNTTFLENLHKQKNKNIYSDIVYPNYRYYQGFLDAGSIEHFFSAISYETDLSEKKIYDSLVRYLPNILPNLEYDFNNWKQDYINTLNTSFMAINKKIEETLFDLETQVFEQLMFLKELK